MQKKSLLWKSHLEDVVLFRSCCSRPVGVLRSSLSTHIGAYVGITPVRWSPFALSLDSIIQLDLLQCPPCLVLNDFWLAPKVICVLQGGRFTTIGNTVTSQLTNPWGVKLFYNKVLILKVRLTPYKS